jgi:hypothetical protein
MAEHSLNDLLSNPKALVKADLSLFDLCDTLFEELRQAAAMASTANSQDFLEK